jgi:Helix-turn-helix domain
VIENPKTAALLFQPKSVELLSVLIESERSLQQISDVLGWPLNTSKYQLERLCQAGLVTCVREEARAGRAIRFYRAIATQFFVPYVLTPAMNPATLLEQEYAAKAKRFAHNLTTVALQAREAQHELNSGEFDWGVRFSLENGKIRQHAAMEEAAHWNFLSDEDPALIDVWDEGLMLSREDAKALQLELCHLIGRYRAKHGNVAYTVRLGLTPEVNASRT